MNFKEKNLNISYKILQFAAFLTLTMGGATLMSGCGGGASAAPSIPPTNNGNLNRIAFSSNRDGNFEIYTMNPDGSDVQRVTTAAGDDTKPAWSRDKTKLAFASERDGNSEIYVQNIAGGKPVGAAQRITNDAASDDAPSWNPDGTQLVFDSNRATRNSENGAVQLERALYIVNVSTKSVRRLTQHPGFTDQNASWSPQGNLIVFQSNDSDFTRFRPQAPDHLFTIEPSGENFKQLTFGGFNKDLNPSWNAAGAKILYQRGFSTAVVEPSNGEIVTLRATSSDLCENPVYSPNGKQIICDGINIIDIDKPNDALKRVTDGLQPSW